MMSRREDMDHWADHVVAKLQDVFGGEWDVHWCEVHWDTDGRHGWANDPGAVEDEWMLHSQQDATVAIHFNDGEPVFDATGMSPTQGGRDDGPDG